ncbi:syncytin-A-like [Alligator mississippiensis]|uniref:syncytin-A-like n=1 Tax=Alligator mississippiensis TaxID=8496 RepID=UPI00287727D0|nr:syncytin-A-like [Alligator mississippiensis]
MALISLYITLGYLSITQGGWEKNLYLQISHAVAQAGNKSDCWICSHSPAHLHQGIPTIGVPISLQQWGTINGGFVRRYSLAAHRSAPKEWRAAPANWIISPRVEAPFCYRSNNTGAYNKATPVGHYPHCLTTLDYSPSSTSGILLGNVPSLNCTGFMVYNFSKEPHVALIANRSEFYIHSNFTSCNISRSSRIAAERGPSYTMHINRKCRIGHNNCRDLSTLSAPGLYWLCGNRAHKILPWNWVGACTLGRVIPGFEMHSAIYLEQVKNFNHHMKRAVNPLATRNTGFHRFVRTFIPWLGVRELELAIINISATMEAMGNATADAIQALQKEISQISQVTIQHRIALDYLLVSQGGVCALVNSTCCVYVNQDMRIETDIRKIRNQLRVLHQVASENTDWGLEEMWSWLTSWLPDFGALGKKILYGILFVLIVLIMFYVLMQLILCCVKASRGSFSKARKPTAESSIMVLQKCEQIERKHERLHDEIEGLMRMEI